MFNQNILFVEANKEEVQTMHIIILLFASAHKSRIKIIHDYHF